MKKPRKHEGDVPRRCITCGRLRGTPGKWVCYEGGFSEIGDPYLLRMPSTEEHCSGRDPAKFLQICQPKEPLRIRGRKRR